MKRTQAYINLHHPLAITRKHHRHDKMFFPALLLSHPLTQADTHTDRGTQKCPIFAHKCVLYTHLNLSNIRTQMCPIYAHKSVQHTHSKVSNIRTQKCPTFAHKSVQHTHSNVSYIVYMHLKVSNMCT